MASETPPVDTIQFRYPPSFRIQVLATGIAFLLASVWLCWNGYSNRILSDVLVAELLLAGAGAFMGAQLLAGVARASQVIECSKQGIASRGPSSTMVEWETVTQVKSRARGPLRVVQILGSGSSSIEFDFKIERASQLIETIAENTIARLTLGDPPLRREISALRLVRSGPGLTSGMLAGLGLVAAVVGLDGLSRIALTLSALFAAPLCLGWLFGYRAVAVDRDAIRIERLGRTVTLAYRDIADLQIGVDSRTQTIVIRALKQNGEATTIPAWDAEAIAIFNTIRCWWISSQL